MHEQSERPLDDIKTVRLHTDVEIDDVNALGTLMASINELCHKAGKEKVRLQSVIISSGNPKLQKTTPMSEKVAFVKSLLEANGLGDVTVMIGCTDITKPFGKTPREKEVVNYIIDNPVDYEITTGPPIELAAARTSLEFDQSLSEGKQKQTTVFVSASVNNWYWMNNWLISNREEANLALAYEPQQEVSPEGLDDASWDKHVKAYSDFYTTRTQKLEAREDIQKFLKYYRKYLSTFDRAYLNEVYQSLGNDFKQIDAENYPNTFSVIQTIPNDSSYKQTVASNNRTIYSSMAKKIVEAFEKVGLTNDLDQLLLQNNVDGATREERLQNFKDGVGVYHDGKGQFYENVPLFKGLMGYVRNNVASFPGKVIKGDIKRLVGIMIGTAGPNRMAQMDQVAAVLFHQVVSADQALSADAPLVETKHNLSSIFELRRLLGFYPPQSRFIYSDIPEKFPLVDMVDLPADAADAVADTTFFYPYLPGGPESKESDELRALIAAEIDALTALGLHCVAKGVARYEKRKKETAVAEAGPSETKGEEDDVFTPVQGPGVPLAQGSSAAVAVFGAFPAPFVQQAPVVEQCEPPMQKPAFT